MSSTPGERLRARLDAQHRRWNRRRAVEPFNLPCSTQYHATNTSGRRVASAIRLAVMHAAEGYSAENTARYESGPDVGQGSTQRTLDWDHCFRLADDLTIVQGVSDVNSVTLHDEMAAFTAWRRATWFLPKHRRMLDRECFKKAGDLIKYGLPPKFVSTAELDAAADEFHFPKGWTTHDALSRSRHSSSTHTDPFAPAIKRLMLGYAKRRIAFFHKALSELAG